MAGEVLVVAEKREGRLHPVSLEAAAFAWEMAKMSGAEVLGLVLGPPGDSSADEFALASGLPVLALEHDLLADYNAVNYTAALKRLVLERKPSRVVVPHTATGWDFAPRLAAAIRGSCSTAVTGLAGERAERCTRPIFGGRVMTEVEPIPDTVWVLTVMPGAIKASAPAWQGRVERIRVEIEEAGSRTLGMVPAPARGLDLSKAEVIVAVGRGVGSEEGIVVVRELASVIEKSALGASRPVVDAGWLGLDHQVGQTGQTVCPRLYIACGISGAMQHLAGMIGAGLVVAINTDPNAPIFSVARLGVVRDMHEFLPVLIEKIRGMKS